jgi:ribosomal protein S27AE
METCPKCGLAWYKDVGQSKVPNKVFRQFPFIPRLKQMFKAPVLSNLMMWHNYNKSTDGLVRHVADSKTWAHIDARWPKFAIEPYNVKLGLTTDGVNSYNEKSCIWSTWPVLLFNYNLPPWLVTKNFFVMLALIILRKESVKMHNIDVYMVPLIEELQMLWKGVTAYDVGRPNGQRHFTLRTILMWIIHDFLAYGLVVGCVHQGYKACPICGPGLIAFHFMELSKVVYEGFHRWLVRDHPYQRILNLAHFNGKKEHRSS